MRASIAVVVLLIFAVLPAGALGDDSPEALGDDSPSAAQQAKVELLADYVLEENAVYAEAEIAAAQDSVSALRQTMGWGALFKLEKLAAALGVDAFTLLDDGGLSGELDFGELRKTWMATMTPEQLEAYNDGVKNFGQLKKASKVNGADKANKNNRADKANKNKGGDE